MFPALCHRVRIAIKHRIDSFRTCVVAVHTLDMAKISNSEEYGKIVKLFVARHTKRHFISQKMKYCSQTKYKHVSSVTLNTLYCFYFSFYLDIVLRHFRRLFVQNKLERECFVATNFYIDMYEFARVLDKLVL